MIPVDIYCDGSSAANGKPECTAGWAMVIPNFRGKMFVRYGHLPPPSSNNKGEILGVLYAMSIFSKQSAFSPTIYSDSQYVVKSCNEWRHKWKLSDYFGIKNEALLVPLFNMIDASSCNPKIVWVKGHAGLKGNELADEFCGLGRQKIIRDKKDDVSDIQYVEFSSLPYNLTAA